MLVYCFPLVMKIEQHVDRLIDQTSIKQHEGFQIIPIQQRKSSTEIYR